MKAKEGRPAPMILIELAREYKSMYTKLHHNSNIKNTEPPRIPYNYVQTVHHVHAIQPIAKTTNRVLPKPTGINESSPE